MLLLEMRKEFENFNFTIMLSAGASVEHYYHSYHVQQMQGHVDLINLLTYDYHGPWEENHQCDGNPMALSHSSIVDVKATVNLWLGLGADTSKLLISIPAFGRSYKLSHGKIGMCTEGPGAPGPISQEFGYLSYHEVDLKQIWFSN